MPRILLYLMLIFLFSATSYADEIVARVNGTELTKKDLEAEVDRLIPRITFHRSVPEEKRKFYYDRALEGLVDKELQYQDALAKGIKPDKEEVDAQMQKMRARFKSQDDYKAALDKEGLTEEKLRLRVEKDMLIQDVIAKTVTEPSQISESDLKGFYEKNSARFKQPEGVKLRLISVKDEEKAKDILDRIKAGEDFGTLAYTMSEDSYRVKSGDIGYMHKGRMLPEIEEAAFKLNQGEVSDIIKAGDFFFIIRLEDKKPEQQVSFDEIKGKLEKELEQERNRELREKWIADLRSKAKIEILLKTGSPESEKK
jgi:parvulin-like peptidyl-prolyl isomerase